MTLYFAYGSNLNKAQMAYRSPDAIPVCPIALDDWLLVFRGVADITPSPGDVVHGAVWKISPDDEAALDRYEGVDARMYRKVYIPIEPFEFGGEMHDELLVYVMNSTGIMPPSVGYLQSIRTGYRDFGLPQASLTAAVERSYDDKAPSHIERNRHMRSGRPTLAARPSEAAKTEKAMKKEAARAKAAQAKAPPTKAEHQAAQRRAARSMVTYGD